MLGAAPVGTPRQGRWVTLADTRDASPEMRAVSMEPHGYQLAKRWGLDSCQQAMRQEPEIIG
eukprot:scaffold240254_cov17-Tisochrysis_lutea.AAC.2